VILGTLPVPGVTGGLTAAEDRGNLVLSERVIEKIAAGAVREVHGAGGGPRRVLGVTVSGSELDEDSNAKVEARLYGRTATVRVEMTARYPDPIRGIAAEVRRIVIERLRVLADVEASLVDVEVVGLSKAAARRRRVR
jgi:uncharacterized alkaline shock family protein YloU